MTQFSDRSHQEFQRSTLVKPRSLLSSRKIRIKFKGAGEHPAVRRLLAAKTPLLDVVDWRAAGKVTAVKDQQL